MATRYEAMETRALAVRRHVLGLAAKGGCFAGAAFSCVEILVALYEIICGSDHDKLAEVERDRLILSKGHAVPALYGLLVELSQLAPARLEAHLRADDIIYWHPNANVRGVDFATGSLGHGLAVAVGMALQFRNRRSNHRVFVLMGDGELNEGSVWEALMIASAQGLGNLALIIDRNGFQANARTEDLSRIEPLADKLASFGCRVVHANGHAFDQLTPALGCIDDRKPLAVIANTVRGRGIPSWENDWEKWFVRIDPTELAALHPQLESVRS